MKLLILSDPSSSHTIKWSKSLAQKNIDVCIFGLNNCDLSIYKDLSNVIVFSSGIDLNVIQRGEGSFSKIRYLKILPKLRRIIKEFKPDILHAHFATSYGLLGALSGFHPYIISIWGTDIFIFPKRSVLHRKIIEYNLAKADKVLSTSLVMAEEGKKYTNKDIEVTPFGVDLNIFKPMAIESPFSPSDIVIGTIKTLEEKYGIEYLIRAFKILSDKYKSLPLKLMIVGEGLLGEKLKKLTEDLNIADKTVFTGKIPYDRIQEYHNILSIYVAVSNSEGFGVAVIEACACSKPVVVSNVGGLPEIVEDGVNGFVVPPRNPEKTAEAIEKLILNPELRNRMGQAGRKKVELYYDWDKNVRQMVNIYNAMLKHA